MTKAKLSYTTLAVAFLLLLATHGRAAFYFNVFQWHYNAPMQSASPVPFLNFHHLPEQPPCFYFSYRLHFTPVFIIRGKELPGKKKKIIIIIIIIINNVITKNCECSISWIIRVSIPAYKLPIM